MRLRSALIAARRFVAARYPHVAHWRLDLALEHDGERRRSWSFGVRPDEEDADRDGASMVGYVHADGTVEGLY